MDFKPFFYCSNSLCVSYHIEFLRSLDFHLSSILYVNRQKVRRNKFDTIL